MSFIIKTIVEFAKKNDLQGLQDYLATHVEDFSQEFSNLYTLDDEKLSLEQKSSVFKEPYIMCGNKLSINMREEHCPPPIEILIQKNNARATQLLIDHFNISPQSLAYSYGKYNYIASLEDLIVRAETLPNLKQILKTFGALGLAEANSIHLDDFITSEKNPIQQFQLKKQAVAGLAKSNLKKMFAIIDQENDLILKQILEEKAALGLGEAGNLDELNDLIAKKQNSSWKKLLKEYGARGLGNHGNLQKITAFLHNQPTAELPAFIPLVCLGLSERAHFSKMPELLEVAETNFNKIPNLSKEDKNNLIRENIFFCSMGMGISGNLPEIISFLEYLIKTYKNNFGKDFYPDIYKKLLLGLKQGQHSSIGESIISRTILDFNDANFEKEKFRLELKTLAGENPFPLHFTLPPNSDTASKQITNLTATLLNNLVKGEQLIYIHSYLKSFHLPLIETRFIKQLGARKEILYLTLPNTTLENVKAFVEGLGSEGYVLEFQDTLIKMSHLLKTPEDTQLLINIFVKALPTKPHEMKTAPKALSLLATFKEEDKDLYLFLKKWFYQEKKWELKLNTIFYWMVFKDSLSGSNLSTLSKDVYLLVTGYLLEAPISETEFDELGHDLYARIWPQNAKKTETELAELARWPKDCYKPLRLTTFFVLPPPTITEEMPKEEARNELSPL